MDTVQRIGQHLVARAATLATAESCTGGLLGHLLTNVAGSSRWYVGGVVSYSNALKHGLLGVREEALHRVGAVSAEVAEQMALGARQAFDTDYALSVTGIAGPGGGSEDKPVGLTFVGLATPEQVLVRRFVWSGSREGNKRSSACAALDLLLETLAPTAVGAAPPTPTAAVEAAFQSDGSIRPTAFVWNGRSMKVTDWGRQWHDQAGGTRHFLVMTRGDRVWELRFTPATLHWSIQPRSEVRHVV